MSEIKIGNMKRGDSGVYCGRPSPLGNPYSLNIIKDRDAVCDLYHDWLHLQIENNNKEVVDELKKLKKIYRDKGELTLLCWCAPLRCHCESIKKVLDNDTIF